MKSILRFYVQLEDGVLKPIPNQKIEDILPDFTLNVASGNNANFYEVKYSIDELSVIEVKPIETDYIRAEAIIAANDHNEALLTDLKEERPNAFDERQNFASAQEFVDRIFKYGIQFTEDELVKALLEKFPVAATMVNTVRIIE
jgi:hypothetical protein